MVTQPTQDDLTEHCLRLRNIVDADSKYCPDDMDGCLVVSYDSVYDANATYTEGRHVSARLPTWCIVFFEDGIVDVSELSDSTKAVIRESSRVYGNEIDFEATETVEVKA